MKLPSDHDVKCPALTGTPQLRLCLSALLSLLGEGDGLSSLLRLASAFRSLGST